MNTEIKNQLQRATSTLQAYLREKPEAKIQIAYLTLQVKYLTDLEASVADHQKFIT